LQNSKNLNFGLGQKMIAVWPPAALIVSIIFLFGPFNIYRGNLGEFTVSLMSILGFYLLPAFVFILILAGIGVFLPKKLHQRYVALIFALGILIWLQGNILVWKYGLLDGQTFDWTKDQWRGWLDGALWILLPITACLFYRQIYKFAGVICIIILSCQLVHLIFVTLNAPETWDTRASFSEYGSAPKEIFNFSSKQNVILIILDAFQSDFFEDILDDDADYYHETLEGFTFFRDTVGSFPTTYMSLPAILSGRTYRNRVPMPEFVKSVLNGRTIPNVLYRKGYEVDLILTDGLFGDAGQYSNKYSLPVPYNVTKEAYTLLNAALTLDLVLFRVVPHYLKKYISIDGLGFTQRLLGQKNYMKLRYFAHKAFMQDLIENMSAERKKPVYKFIHLCTTHPPFVVDANCEYSGKLLPPTRKNIKNQAKCGLNHIIEFLKKLKLKGIYASSFIIISADTGLGEPVKMRNMDRCLNGDSVRSNEEFEGVVGSALPLLLVKPPYSKGPLRVSDVPSALTDIPATVSACLGLDERFGGKSLYEIASKENRERRFCYYLWRHENWQSEYFEHLEEFIIRGSVFDKCSWRCGSFYYRPGSSYKIGKVNFGSDEIQQFLLHGWGDNEGNPANGTGFNWALGDSASMRFSIPKDQPVCLRANVLSYPFREPQRVTIMVDGEVVGRWTIDCRQWHEHSVMIDKHENRPEVSVVKFLFSQHLTERKTEKRPLSVRFAWLALDEGCPSNEKGIAKGK